jgi:amphi-Trp domain-containing protein
MEKRTTEKTEKSAEKTGTTTQHEAQKLKETFEPSQLASFAHSIGNAIDQNRDVEFDFEGKTYYIPVQALKEGEIEVDLDSKSDKVKLELELKWKHKEKTH